MNYLLPAGNVRAVKMPTLMCIGQARANVEEVGRPDRSYKNGVKMRELVEEVRRYTEP